jgi:hypothetical protein
LFFTIISFSARLFRHKPFISALIEAVTGAEPTTYIYARNVMEKAQTWESFVPGAQKNTCLYRKPYPTTLSDFGSCNSLFFEINSCSVLQGIWALSEQQQHHASARDPISQLTVTRFCRNRRERYGNATTVRACWMARPLPPIRQ